MKHNQHLQTKNHRREIYFKTQNNTLIMALITSHTHLLRLLNKKYDNGL